MAKGMSREFFRIFSKFASYRIDYNLLLSNEEERPRSKLFAMRAISSLIAFLVCTALFAASAIGALKAVESGNFILIIVGVILFAALLSFLVLMLFALIQFFNCIIKQRRLNKQKIGLVVLIVGLILIAAGIAGAAVSVILIMGA